MLTLTVKVYKHAIKMFHLNDSKSFKRLIKRAEIPITHRPLTFGSVGHSSNSDHSQKRTLGPMILFVYNDTERILRIGKGKVCFYSQQMNSNSTV